MNVIEKVEFNHPRMGVISQVTLKYGKPADEDWNNMSLNTIDEKNEFERHSREPDLNRAEIHFNEMKSQGKEGNLWVVSIVTEDKKKQTFVNLLPSNKDENDILAFFN